MKLLYICCAIEILDYLHANLPNIEEVNMTTPKRSRKPTSDRKCQDELDKTVLPRPADAGRLQAASRKPQSYLPTIVGLASCVGKPEHT